MILDRLNPRVVLILGIVLMLAGVALPFLIVIHVLESTFLLNFLAFAASVSGLLLGVVGVALTVTRGRRK